MTEHIVVLITTPNVIEARKISKHSLKKNSQRVATSFKKLIQSTSGKATLKMIPNL
jgi:hydroxymethylpyrimidine/phosphomethylpyrimidine kinase